VGDSVKFVDDNDRPVKTVTAEQHALDNPGHILRVYYWTGMLRMNCGDCDWFDDKGYTGVQKPGAHKPPNPNEIALENIAGTLREISATLMNIQACMPNIGKG